MPTQPKPETIVGHRAKNPSRPPLFEPLPGPLSAPAPHLVLLAHGEVQLVHGSQELGLGSQGVLLGGLGQGVGQGVDVEAQGAHLAAQLVAALSPAREGGGGVLMLVVGGWGRASRQRATLAHKLAPRCASVARHIAESHSACCPIICPPHTVGLAARPGRLVHKFKDQFQRPGWSVSHQ